MSNPITATECMISFNEAIKKQNDDFMQASYKLFEELVREHILAANNFSHEK